MVMKLLGGPFDCVESIFEVVIHCKMSYSTACTKSST